MQVGRNIKVQIFENKLGFLNIITNICILYLCIGLYIEDGLQIADRNEKCMRLLLCFISLQSGIFLSFNIPWLPQTCLQILTCYRDYYNYIPGAMGAQHMVLNEEQAAFSDWINNNLRHDKDVSHLLPLNVMLLMLVVIV